ncbi:membrane metallo-endopeptidase-like 1 isoform X1 [Mya arenaria]|uniref:membrane metallo-endopeptidase-like 1 isoform X1 n=1 Tax=Mya arenaria TaxID=6604 RepID=UPI0022E24E2B|nr:membrane metallo-endopeptidase-like 1 isoform X1 [Mya arenaria]
MKSFNLHESTDTLHRNGATSQSGATRLLAFLVVLFALATVALAVVLAFTVLKVEDDKEPVPTVNPAETESVGKEDVCLTEGCVMAAARVRAAMNPTADPCADFYQFSCGGWLKTNVIPEDKSSFGSFYKIRDDVDIIVKGVLEAENKPEDPQIVRKARNYYKICMNEKKVEDLGLTYLLHYLETLDGLPALGPRPGGRWNKASFDIVNLMVKARKGVDLIPLIDIGVMQDDKKPTNYILYVDQPDLGMPSRDYYLKERNDTMLMAYQTLMKDFMVAIGVDETTASQDAQDVVDMEIELANITIPKEERRDPEKMYNKMTVTELTQNFTDVDWMRLVSGTFKHIGITLPTTEPVVAVAPAFLEKIGSLLHKYPARTLATYVLLQRTVGKTFYLPEMFRAIKQKYNKVLSGTATVPARWQSCAGSVKSAMPEVVGRLFVQEAFKEDAKKDVLMLVDKLREAFKEMIDGLPWMAYTTKQTAKEKANFIDPRIGYQDLVYKDAALEEKYENVTIDVEDPLKTLVNIGEAGVVETLQKLRKTYDKSEWHMSPATVNAYYMSGVNSITFPAAILQPPFYSKDQPAYLNFGGIGYVIGHEITHGFDDRGRLYDKFGNLESWWSEQDTERFKERAQCIIDQYDGFVVPGTGNMTINGINTQGENIADNGGIKESFWAYRKWVESARGGREEEKLPGLDYTPNQLYFLNAAQVWCGKMRDSAKIERIRTDPHSIMDYRVYGPLQNFDEFSRAWQCPEGSYMNPRKKCSVW